MPIPKPNHKAVCGLCLLTIAHYGGKSFRVGANEKAAHKGGFSALIRSHHSATGDCGANPTSTPIDLGGRRTTYFGGSQDNGSVFEL